MGRPLEEAQKLAHERLTPWQRIRLYMGGADAIIRFTNEVESNYWQHRAEEAESRLAARGRVIEAARAYVEADSGDTPRTYNELRDAVLADSPREYGGTHVELVMARQLKHPVVSICDAIEGLSIEFVVPGSSFGPAEIVVTHEEAEKLVEDIETAIIFALADAEPASAETET